MTDELARQLGLTDNDIAGLDRLAELMTDGPQPPDGGPEDDVPQAPSRGLLRQASSVVLLALLVAFVVLAGWGLLRLAVWLGQHGMLPAPN